MSRIFLGGVGEPIPLEALPDPVTGDLPPIRILLNEDEDFVKADFVSLGYTHWECWAIGAMGGKGGRPSSSVTWTTVRTRPTMSSSDWQDYLEMQSIFASQLVPPYGPYAPWGPGEAGMIAYYEEQFPAHNPYYQDTYSNPVLRVTADIYGGAGGGGGLHHVSGLLSALAGTTTVIIGEVGADGATGQVRVNGLWTPLPDELTTFEEGGTYWSTEETRLKELNNYFARFRALYPLPHTSFSAPAVGSDGGVSSFGGALCRASGGKGGKAAQKWVGGVLTVDAVGGDGGEGGTATAGGGGAGSSTTANGSDGGWDGNIGEGGGGGHGGHASPLPAAIAANGGQGSYSFADTDVYGNRGVRLGSYEPGGGGGAKIGSYKYGGAAVGWNPEGAVILRLTSIV